MDKEQMIKELGAAFELLRRIPVSHENVEIMAEAKAHLRVVNAGLIQMDAAPPAKEEADHA